MPTPESDLQKRYPFLHTHIARDPHVGDIMDEIVHCQQACLASGMGDCATLEELKTSRNIRIPFSPTRNKTIVTVMDNLIRSYPDELRPLITFSFDVEAQTRKLSILEKTEYTLQLSNEDFNRLQQERDDRSALAILGLLANFRLFNLTKLLKKTTSRAHLSLIIKSQLGSNIFTFKSYALDRTGMEFVEDLCFHRSNYQAVQKSLNIDTIRKIIQAQIIPINRRLQKFGILNADFSEYRDTKLDYLLNIIMDDILAGLAPVEVTEVKNFHARRTCLMKVEKLIDPLETAGNECAAYIRQNGYCTSADILAIYPDFTTEMLENWVNTAAERFRIIYLKDESGQIHFIDGSFFYGRLAELHQQILYDREAMETLDHAERHRREFQLDLFCAAGRTLIVSPERATIFLGTAEKAARVREITEECDDFRRSAATAQILVTDETFIEEESLVKKIVQFFGSLFGRGRPTTARSAPAGQGTAARVRRTTISGETRSVYAKIKSSSSRILALSNYLEIIPANESRIQTIIDDLRELNLKIVIPIYNARKQLYPNRSQQYLMADVEYILVPPDVIQTPEEIREFTDAIVGEKLKDEAIPPGGILTIEKYLLTLYRQKRAQMKRRPPTKKAP